MSSRNSHTCTGWSLSPHFFSLTDTHTFYSSFGPPVNPPLEAGSHSLPACRSTVQTLCETLLSLLILDNVLDGTQSGCHPLLCTSQVFKLRHRLDTAVSLPLKNIKPNSTPQLLHSLISTHHIHTLFCLILIHSASVLDPFHNTRSYNQ